MLLPDGRLGLIDYGQVKHIDLQTCVRRTIVLAYPTEVAVCDRARSGILRRILLMDLADGSCCGTATGG
jgi:hypothetical protein